MIIQNEPNIDLNPVKGNLCNVDILIEKIRNLQDCITQELRNSIIDKAYIGECQSEINKTLLEIYDKKKYNS